MLSVRNPAAGRRNEELRAERLAELQAQIADGTLVVRHMSGPEHRRALEAARQIRARNQARRSLRSDCVPTRRT